MSVNHQKVSQGIIFQHYKDLCRTTTNIYLGFADLITMVRYSLICPIKKGTEAPFLTVTTISCFIS